MMHVVARLLMFVMTVWILWRSSPSFSSLFSWHPPLMMLAFTLAMPEGQLGFGIRFPYAKLGNRASRVQLHWSVQNIAFLAACVGFFAIAYNKYVNGFSHFATWHALVGLLACLFATVQASLGFFLSYPSFFSKTFLRWVNWIHLWIGTATVVAGMSAAGLACWSNWAVNELHPWTLLSFRLIVALNIICYLSYSFDKYSKRMASPPVRKQEPVVKKSGSVAGGH